MPEEPPEARHWSFCSSDGASGKGLRWRFWSSSSQEAEFEPNKHKKAPEAKQEAPAEEAEFQQRERKPSVKRKAVQDEEAEGASKKRPKAPESQKAPPAAQSQKAQAKKPKPQPEAHRAEPEPVQGAGSPEALPYTEVRQKRLREKETRQKVRDAGGPKLYREQQQQQKDEVPVPEALLKKRLRQNYMASWYRAHREKVGAAGGLEQYREQQQKAKLLRQLYRQQQRDRTARRAKEKARARKTRAVVRDEGQPAAQLLATQVVELLRRPGMFDRCLSSLQKLKKGKVCK